MGRLRRQRARERVILGDEGSQAAQTAAGERSVKLLLDITSAASEAWRGVAGAGFAESVAGEVDGSIDVHWVHISGGSVPVMRLARRRSTLICVMLDHSAGSIPVR